MPWTVPPPVSGFYGHDIPGVPRIFQRIGHFAARLRVEMEPGLSARDLISQPRVQGNAGGGPLRRACQLGQARQLAIVDVGDAAGLQRDQRFDVGGLRRFAQSALG